MNNFGQQNPWTAYGIEARHLPPELATLWLHSLNRTTVRYYVSVPGFNGNLEFPRDWEALDDFVPAQVHDYFWHHLERPIRWQ